jgi:vacuolar-type H+-ATPase subunit H
MSPGLSDEEFDQRRNEQFKRVSQAMTDLQATREKALGELVQQAQELNMGY